MPDPAGRPQTAVDLPRHVGDATQTRDGPGSEVAVEPAINEGVVAHAAHGQPVARLQQNNRFITFGNKAMSINIIYMYINIIYEEDGGGLERLDVDERGWVELVQ